MPRNDFLAMLSDPKIILVFQVTKYPSVGILGGCWIAVARVKVTWQIRLGPPR